jgi:serine/threonine protein kinase
VNKILGKGSFGKVYYGLLTLLNLPVAIKCIDKAHIKDDIAKNKVF